MVLCVVIGPLFLGIGPAPVQAQTSPFVDIPIISCTNDPATRFFNMARANESTLVLHYRHACTGDFRIGTIKDGTFAFQKTAVTHSTVSSAQTRLFNTDDGSMLGCHVDFRTTSATTSPKYARHGDPESHTDTNVVTTRGGRFCSIAPIGDTGHYWWIISSSSDNAFWIRYLDSNFNTVTSTTASGLHPQTTSASLKDVMIASHPENDRLSFIYITTTFDNQQWLAGGYCQGNAGNPCSSITNQNDYFLLSGAADANIVRGFAATQRGPHFNYGWYGAVLLDVKAEPEDPPERIIDVKLYSWTTGTHTHSHSFSNQSAAALEAGIQDWEWWRPHIVSEQNVVVLIWEAVEPGTGYTKIVGSGSNDNGLNWGPIFTIREDSLYDGAVPGSLRLPQYDAVVYDTELNTLSVLYQVLYPDTANRVRLYVTQAGDAAGDPIEGGGSLEFGFGGTTDPSPGGGGGSGGGGTGGGGTGTGSFGDGDLGGLHPGTGEKIFRIDVVAFADATGMPVVGAQFFFFLVIFIMLLTLLVGIFAHNSEKGLDRSASVVCAMIALPMAIIFAIVLGVIQLWVMAAAVLISIAIWILHGKYTAGV